MFRRISRQERERPRRQGRAGNDLAGTALERARLPEAQDPFYIDQLTYQHAALMCRCRALLRTLRAEGGGAMTEYWPCLLAAVRHRRTALCRPASGTECAVCWRGPSAVLARWPCWACWSR